MTSESRWKYSALSGSIDGTSKFSRIFSISTMMLPPDEGRLEE